MKIELYKAVENLKANNFQKSLFWSMKTWFSPIITKMLRITFLKHPFVDNPLLCTTRFRTQSQR